MTQFTILSGKAMIVELPEGATRIYPNITHGRLLWIENEAPCLTLPPGTWQIVGMLPEVRESEAATCVKLHATIKKYRDYLIDNDRPTDMFTKTALESLESAIRAEGYHLDVNPIPEPHLGEGVSDDWVTDYNNAQSRVLCRERTLILRRV